jgi:hypothetical protein
MTYSQIHQNQWFTEICHGTGMAGEKIDLMTTPPIPGFLVIYYCAPKEKNTRNREVLLFPCFAALRA